MRGGAANLKGKGIDGCEARSKIGKKETKARNKARCQRLNSRKNFGGLIMKLAERTRILRGLHLGSWVGMRCRNEGCDKKEKQDPAGKSLKFIAQKVHSISGYLNFLKVVNEKSEFRRLKKHLSKPTPLRLQADVPGDSSSLYWFVEEGWVGQSRAGEALNWIPAHAGAHTIRAVDEQGRSSVRQIQVEFVP